MPAWRDMKPKDRDRVFLAAAFFNESDPININPRSKNDREWAASMVKRGLLTKEHRITRAGKTALRNFK